MPCRLTALFFAAMALSGCFITPDSAACAASTCQGCLALGGCGFCTADGQCRPGSSLGDDAALCDGASWRFASCDVAVGGGGRCGRAGFCSTCTDEDGCGWCFGGGGCLEGTSAGPTSGTCASGQWAFGPSVDCDAAECQAARNCDECMDRRCAWCSAGGYCGAIGVISCPYDYQINYFDSPRICPTTDRCSSLGTCAACVDESGCSFCVDYSEALGTVRDSGCFPTGTCPAGFDYQIDSPLNCTW